MTAGELLARLLAVTPPPPDGADVDDLLASADAMKQAREAVLAGVTASPIATPAEAEQLALLQRRDHDWDALLRTTLQRIAVLRAGATKVRAYAQTLSAGCR